MSARLGVFERWLSLWVALCIAAGIGLGSAFPGAFAALAALEIASVNLADPFVNPQRGRPRRVADVLAKRKPYSSKTVSVAID